MLAIGVSFFCSNAAALEFGRTGRSYTIEGNKWHDVQIKDESFFVTGSIPGSPKPEMKEGWINFESLYHNSYYSYQASLPSINYVVPKNEDELNRFYNYAALGGKFEKFHSDKKNVKYAVQANFMTKEGFHGRMRIYTTDKNIYILTVVGYDLSLADNFFDSFDIKK